MKLKKKYINFFINFIDQFSDKKESFSQDTSIFRKTSSGSEKGQRPKNRNTPESNAADSPMRCRPVKNVISEIGTKMHVSHKSQESPKKIKEALSVHPFLSESDINSEGEATKTYTFSADHISRSVIPGEVVPTAFAKTNINTKESQIY